MKSLNKLNLFRLKNQLPVSTLAFLIALILSSSVFAKESTEDLILNLGYLESYSFDLPVKITSARAMVGAYTDAPMIFQSLCTNKYGDPYGISQNLPILVKELGNGKNQISVPRAMVYARVFAKQAGKAANFACSVKKVIFIALELQEIGSEKPVRSRTLMRVDLDDDGVHVSMAEYNYQFTPENEIPLFGFRGLPRDWDSMWQEMDIESYPDKKSTFRH